MPSLDQVSLDALTSNGAVIRLRRDDFPDTGDAGLLRQTSQQGHRNVGFDVVLAHVAGVSAVDNQEVHHVVHVAGQVNGHRHRPCRVDGGVRGGLLCGKASLLNRGNQLVELGAEVGVLRLLLLRHGEVLWAVALDDGHGYGQRDEQSEKRQQGEQSFATHGRFLLRFSGLLLRGGAL